MVEKPDRRWFRFRLLTVLILTAIAAWGMALRPYVDWGYGITTDTHYDSRIPVRLSAGLDRPGEIDPFDPEGDDADNVYLSFIVVWPKFSRIWWVSLGPKAILFPASALAAFLVWKAIERRRARRATHY